MFKVQRFMFQDFCRAADDALSVVPERSRRIAEGSVVSVAFMGCWCSFLFLTWQMPEFHQFVLL